MADEEDVNGDDVGWWDCSLCTYKNSSDKFKCEICDLRRGTSTRKPRCSTDTIVAQVVKQQEQIRQQTKAKPSPKTKPSRDRERDRERDRARDRDRESERDIPVTTPEPTTSSPHNNNNNSSAASTITNVSTASTTSSKSSPSTPTTPNSSKPYQQSQDSPIKIKPIEINGNLIKYLPPTSTGRTGLIIDKKRFTQHSVTVGDVTITFTEFATRQNKYVRKKKKKSGSKSASSNSLSGVKIDPK